MSSTPFTEKQLFETLGASQRLGFLGAAPLVEVVAHARRFVAALPADARRIVDLGAGGGVPGLVVACDRPEVELVMIDRRRKRIDALTRWVHGVGLTERVRVVGGEASELARGADLRGWADAVVARGLGPPGVTAELSRGFLGPFGVLVVSEPPEPQRDQRWPTAGLALLGLQLDDLQFPGVVRIRASEHMDQAIPRRRPTPPLF